MVRHTSTVPPSREGPRANEFITTPQVRLIDETGENRGVVDTEEAIGMADNVGLDLVEISPNAAPPVCKIMDCGRFKYEAQKRANEARKKQKTIDVKEIKMRPGIETADYQVKMRNIVRFLNDGDKVKVTLRFRGREMAHQERGMDVLKRVEEDLEGLAKVEQMPKLEGRQMTMVVARK